jgi:hypothetical protein
MARISLRRIGTALAAVAILAAFSTSAAFASNGNNGTVKIQEGAANAEPTTQNEPHVCTFHMLFLFADAGQAGSWSIDEQPPTGRDPSGLSGSYLTDANGQYATVEYGLPIGHYTLNWEGRNDQNIKHKTFWVTCDNPPGPIGGGG